MGLGWGMCSTEWDMVVCVFLYKLLMVLSRQTAQYPLLPVATYLTVHLIMLYSEQLLCDFIGQRIINSTLQKYIKSGQQNSKLTTVIYHGTNKLTCPFNTETHAGLTLNYSCCVGAIKRCLDQWCFQTGSKQVYNSIDASIVCGPTFRFWRGT